MDRFPTYTVLPKLLPPIDVSFELIWMACSMVVNIFPRSLLDVERISFLERDRQQIVGDHGCHCVELVLCRQD
jgi:hypothetical protein